MEIRSSLLQVGVVVLGVALLATAAAAVNPSYSKQVPLDTLPFYPGGTYDRAISDPEAFFGSPIGGYPIRYHELVGYLERLAAESPRIEHRTHGETHEGRALHHLIISSEANIAALDQIREGIKKLPNPVLRAPSRSTWPACRTPRR